MARVIFSWKYKIPSSYLILYREKFQNVLWFWEIRFCIHWWIDNYYLKKSSLWFSTNDQEKKSEPRPEFKNNTRIRKRPLKIKQLKLIQNFVASILNTTKRVDHISPGQRSFHWLPVFQRKDFKILNTAVNAWGLKSCGDLLILTSAPSLSLSPVCAGC